MRGPALHKAGCSARQRLSVRAQATTTAAPTGSKAATRVRLGESDLVVSACCLGTMTFGKQNTQAEAHEQLSYTWDQGLNFLDTAEQYPVPPQPETQGSTEKFIGTWMKGRKREDVIVATKVSGYTDRATWVRNPPRTTRVNREHIQEAVNASLQRLQTDYIDLLQIHWPDRYVPLFGQTGYDIRFERPDDIPFEEQLRALEEVVKAGKVRYIGVSNETSYGVAEFCHLAKAAGLPKIQTIQNVYSLLVRVPYETDLAETCRRHNVSLLAYSPLSGGSLSNKYNVEGHEKHTANSRFNVFPGYMARYNESMTKQVVTEYSMIAAKYGMTPAQMAMAWCKSRWFVTSTIIGATSMPQLEENIKAFDLELPEQCVADIQALYKKHRDPTTLI